MDIKDAKATLSDLETRLNSAMQAKIDKLSPPPDHVSVVDQLGSTSAGLGCIVEVASDHNAMIEALAEYGFRMVMECGAGWGVEVFKLERAARDRVMEKLADEVKQRRGR
jgi:hypothetical protein